MFVLRSILAPIGCSFTLLVLGCSDETTSPFNGNGSGGSSNPGSGGSVATSGGSGGKASGMGGATASGGAANASGGSSAGGSPSGGTSAGGASSAGGNAGNLGGSPNSATAMNVFVTSDTAPSGNLSGIGGADLTCQTLAAAVGRGGVNWHAYLSTENPLVNAIDRIGEGPYYNSKGMLVAADKTALHARAGDAELFLDENGVRINGQWQGSPEPNEHDIMTGSNSDGSLKPGATCGDWTSAEGSVGVGHSDGLGPDMDMQPPRNSWNGAHNGACGDPMSSGGAGRIYCFVAP